MSRYGFNVNNVEIVVGWDNPCQTFFGQTEVDGTEVVNTMLGMKQFDVQCLNLLEKMIGFNIPDDIRTKLIHNRDNAPDPTPLQKAMGRIIKPMLEDK